MAWQQPKTTKIYLHPPLARRQVTVWPDLKLISKGVAADRLEAVGYGPDRPVADNRTSKGRAENRRTEFNVLAVEE